MPTFQPLLTRLVTGMRGARSAVLPPRSEEFDLDLPAGRVHAARHGSAQAPLVLCLPGLAENLRAFDYLGERIGGRRHQLVALDLRGRGRSEVTAPGTYGWARHGADAVAAADQLGALRFAIIGHSMGGYVAMEAARQAPDRVLGVLLIDVAGAVEPGAVASITLSAQRLDRPFRSAAEYTAAVRQLGAFKPWNRYWQRYLDYELVEDDGRVRARTDRRAVLEDTLYAGTHDARRLWRHLTMPTLLLRATRSLGGGFVVSNADAAAFRSQVPGAQFREIDANHYGIVMHWETVRALAAFLPRAQGNKEAGQ